MAGVGGKAVTTAVDQCKQLVDGTRGPAVLILRQLLQSLTQDQFEVNYEQMILSYRSDNSPQILSTTSFNIVKEGIDYILDSYSKDKDYYLVKATLESADVTQLDITLVTTLLQNVCGLKIYDPKMEDTTKVPVPSPGDDMETEKLVTVLRHYRNIFNHQTESGIQDRTDPDLICRDLVGAIVRLGELCRVRCKVSREMLSEWDTAAGPHTSITMEQQGGEAVNTADQCQQLLQSPDNPGPAVLILRHMLELEIQYKFNVSYQKLIASYRSGNIHPDIPDIVNIEVKDKIKRMIEYEKTIKSDQINELDINLTARLLQKLCGFKLPQRKTKNAPTLPDRGATEERDKLVYLLWKYSQTFTDEKFEGAYKKIINTDLICRDLVGAIVRLGELCRVRCRVSRETLCEWDTAAGPHTSITMQQQEIQKYLKDAYTKKVFYRVNALPSTSKEQSGESNQKPIVLDLRSEDMMPMVFTAETRQLQQQPTTAQGHSEPHTTTDAARGSDDTGPPAAKRLKPQLLMSDAQIPPFHSEAGSDSTVQEFKYEKVFGVLEFDDVVKKLTEVNKRAVLCLGDAGMGKTICLKNIVCSFFEDGSRFMLKQAKSFKLIYYIPVRDVDTKATVVDILCSLNLIQPHMKQTLRCILEDKEAACKVLLLLDGLDEKDVEEGTELHQLIHGEIYPHVKLIMSARPQATVLKHFYPNVRVTIKGTTEEGVTTYLRNTSRIVTSIAEKDIDDVISRCKKQMYNYELLQVPLYLTLMRKIIIDYCKKEDKIENFVVPKTRTSMLNRFILNIVQNWLIRLGREEEANDLFFQRNILQKSSVAPRDIKQKFLAFSRLSYHCMLSEVYDFDDDCLNRYHIPPKDVTKSGLFHWSELGGKLQCSFTHKQFQEYLSGLYMADYRYNYVQKVGQMW